ncbi:hypothetical protein GQX73_g7015 [Xylaria multiplex]|uniref:Uncharacterized protein n=1 Tax=Xylaria multiplex TaxID=323545 RepID=A0A7C8MS03_9PEZI|nr:hypothetical protein GQX73_g7015 [Xylaria multiplex]
MILTPDAPSQTAIQSSSCQAIFFFYTCGCRTLEPFFCCQPSTRPHEATGNPCLHENPTLLTAKLPHSCNRVLGTSEACGAEDPNKKEFVREVDTAGRLELVMSTGIQRDNIRNALPKKVQGAFTIDQVAPKSKQDGNGKRKSTFSPTATPFIPRLAPGSTTAKEGSVDIPYGDGAKAVGDASIDNAEMDTDEGALEEHEEYEKSEKRQHNSSKLVDEAAHAEAIPDTHEEENEFVDIDLKEHEVETQATESAVEDVGETKEPESTTQPEDPYDETMRFYGAPDDEKKPKPTRTCYWAIAAVFGRFTRKI